MAYILNSQSFSATYFGICDWKPNLLLSLLPWHRYDQGHWFKGPYWCLQPKSFAPWELCCHGFHVLSWSLNKMDVGPISFLYLAALINGLHSHNLCRKGWYQQHSHNFCRNCNSHKACGNSTLWQIMHEELFTFFNHSLSCETTGNIADFIWTYTKANTHKALQKYLLSKSCLKRPICGCSYIMSYSLLTVCVSNVRNIITRRGMGVCWY